MNCELDFFSFQTNPSQVAVPAHKHNCFELVYYINGYGTTSIGKKRYDFRNNCFTIISPNTLHTEHSFEETNIIYFGFKYDNAPIHLVDGVYTDNTNNSILHLVEKMKNEIMSKNLNFDLMLNYLISEIIIEIDRLISNKKIGNETSFSYIINFINENYYKQIDLHSLADLSCLSFHRFRHLFKETTGFSPTKFILQTRLTNAKNLLKNSTTSITNIALLCGFSNNSQFSTLFKEMYGLSPRTYRALGNKFEMDQQL